MDFSLLGSSAMGLSREEYWIGLPFPSPVWETWVQSLCWEDPLKKGIGFPLKYSSLENSLDYI